MTYTNTEEKKLNPNAPHWSDGSELIPAEVQANIRRSEEDHLPDVPVALGFTKDEEGLLNNYAIEPDLYPAEYPSSGQQRRYIFMAAGAIVFIAMLLLISFAVSGS